MNLRIPDLESRILLERDGLIVVNKPYDVPTSGHTLDDADCVQYWLMKRRGGMVWVAHQLDADTTGLNLFVTQRHLVSAYMKRLVDPASSKRYLAVVHGSPAWDACEEHGPIGEVDDRNLGVHPDGKPARSHFEVLARTSEFALIGARIFTGRTHQIRIHLRHLGHPLVGEQWYIDEPCRVHHRQALHAWRLELAGDAPLHLEAPLAPDLVALRERLGLRFPNDG